MDDSFSKREIAFIIAVITIVIAAFVVVLTNIESWLNPEEDGQNTIALDMKTVEIDGVKYVPKNISTFLIMGVDKNGYITVNDPEHEQTDFITYIICNHATSKYSVLHINRDSIVPVRELSINDKVVRRVYEQIALAHTYGSNETAKIGNTVDAVKKLLLDKINVDYAISMSMPAVKSINSLVGGVSVTITDKCADEALGYHEGDVIELNDNNVLDFVRERQSASDKTNLARMQRQMVFVDAFMDKLRTKQVTYSGMLEVATNYLYSDAPIDVLDKFITCLAEYTFDGVITLSGQNDFSNEFVEYHVDETSVKSYLKEYYYDKRT